MKNVAHVQEMLDKLVKLTDSPVYAVCSDITAYLERNPNQHNLTIGGLRAALERSVKDDNVLIQAAFTLTGHPFNTLEVRYKLYDELMLDVQQEIDHPTYIHAKSVGNFIDEDGNDISVEELDARVFPYFINVLHESKNFHYFSITGDE